MESVDGLFGDDIIDEIDKQTPDSEIRFDVDGDGDEQEFDDEDDDVVEIDDESLEALFGDFNGDFGMPEGGMSGIGEADDGSDDEGVPIPEELLNPNGQTPKKDKRTSRSQAHKKQKEAKEQNELPRESGIYAEDEDFAPDMNSIATEEEIVDLPQQKPRSKTKKSKTKSASASATSSIVASDVASGVTSASTSTTNTKKKSTRATRELIYEEEERDYDSLPDEEEDWSVDVDDAYEEVDLPDWADSIRRKVNANVAHAFLLNGNVRDYMVRNISIKDGIVAVLDSSYENFDIIAEYDQAHGIYFYGDDILIRDGRTLADAYKENFIEEMKAAQRRMNIPETDEIPNRDPVALFTILSNMFNYPSEHRAAKILLFIDYSDLLVPDASSAQMKPDERKLAITLSDIGRSQAADDAGNVLIFITDDMTQLSTRIRSAESRIEQIKIPIPNRDERADFIDNVLDVPENTLSDGTQVFEHEDSISKEAFAINSAGLSRIQIEDIMLRALSEDTPLTMQLMKERKQEIIREDYDDVLEIIDPKTGFERIGGLDHMKRFFIEEIIEPIHAGEKESVPMGTLLQGPPGTSKPYISSTPIHTLNSKLEHEEKTIGEIEIGDLVFNRWGGATRVLDVRSRGKKEVYEVVLKDGRRICCSADHPWATYRENEKYLHERTVQEMLDEGLFENDLTGKHQNRLRFSIPMNKEAYYPEQDLAVDAYVMGCFLGDGCCTSKQLTILSADPEIPEEIARLIGDCHPVKLQHGYSWVFKYNSDVLIKLRQQGIASKTQQLVFTEHLFEEYPEVMCLAGEKKIPEQYKYASIEQRYALVQGLLDTDGTIVKDKRSQPRGNISFSSTSYQLVLDLREVLFSLGIGSTLTIQDRRGQKRFYKGKEYERKSVEYRLNINCPNSLKPQLFRLSRKKKEVEHVKDIVKGHNYDRIRIAEINKLDKTEDMTCITVAMPDGLFLVGKEYVVGHNTMLSKAVAHEAGMNFVALNLNRIMEKWVGSTERNLDRALDCALAMAPTIIFIDEIDEALPNRADPNASSVNKRINQRLLTFFSDTTHRGEVVILAATNYPEKIDPAFKRAGRFDVRVPIFAPDEFDRMRIMRVIAESRGYHFSWFEDPDTLVDNPFKKLKEWLHEGNSPISDDRHFTGDRELYSYSVKDNLGNDVRYDVYIPIRTIRIIDKDKITLQQLYENVNILMPDLPIRQPDASTGEIETDEVYKKNILEYIQGRTDILGHDEANMKSLFKRIWKWEQVYSAFVRQTFRMTGAEMDVIMNKAINLYKKWKRSKPENFQQALASKMIQDDHDIPWFPFLMEACKRTVNAVAGIKQMEDMALINTSDTDFIPDALYGQLDDGRVISYRERHEELTAKQEKSTL